MAETFDNFKDVGDFHRKFGLHTSDEKPGPVFISADLYRFRREFLHEELAEFEQGWADGDPAQMADALIDLVYVAMGTAHLFGFPWDALWADVQQANMAKERATEETLGSRKSLLDVVKPPGWEPPMTADILRLYGWD